MHRTLIVAVCTAAALALLVPSSALACSCLRISAQHYFDSADAIFVGRAHEVPKAGRQVFDGSLVSSTSRSNEPTTEMAVDGLAPCQWEMTSLYLT